MTTEVEAWIYFDGPVPEHIKPLLETMRSIRSLSPADSKRILQNTMKRIDEMSAAREAASGALESSVRPLAAGHVEPSSDEQPRSMTEETRAPRPDFDDPTAKVPVMAVKRADANPLRDTSKPRTRALPLVFSVAGAENADFPTLTLEQYASFQAELAFWPTQSARIYQRYHVANNTARVALEEHWASHFEAQAEAQAKYQEAFAEYVAWLRDANRK